MCRLHQFFLSLPVADSIQGSYPLIYGVRVLRMGDSTHTELLNKIESKAFRAIHSPPLTVFSFLYSATILHLLLSSTVKFMLTALLNLLTACLPPSRGHAAYDFQQAFIPIMSIYLMQELTSILNFSSLLMVNSGTLYLNLYFHLATT